MLNPQAPAGPTATGSDNYNLDPSKLNPELLQKFMQAACQGQFGPQAKQMAEAAKGSSDGAPAPQDGQQQQQGGDQGAQPPPPGRTLASKHIFGRPGMGAPQDNDQDDQYAKPQAPMGARNIFGR